MRKTVFQGSVYLCNLSGAIGSEQIGTNRPCLVVQNNFGNIYSNCTQVVPITSKQTDKIFDFQHVLLKSKYPFFSYDKNIVLCEQLRTIDKSRINYFLGRIEENELVEIREKIFKNLGGDTSG